MKRLNHIAKQNLFDDEEDLLYKKKFSINIDGKQIKFTLDDFDDNELLAVGEEIDQEDLQKILTTEKFNIVSNDLQSEEELGIYYLIKDKLLLILSYGEFQSGRMMVFLESVWKKE